MNRILRLTLIVMLCGVQEGFSQMGDFDPSGAVNTHLQNAVISRFGSGYVSNFYVLDSLIAKGFPDGYYGEELGDPYGTLHGCVLFDCYRLSNGSIPKDSIVTGIMKNGQIIWDNYPGLRYSIGTHLLGMLDLNKDHEVDILSTWSSAGYRTQEGDHLDYLSVLGWNGSIGHFINDVFTDSASGPLEQFGKPTLISEGGLFGIFDVDGDGIMEIRGTVPEMWLDDFPEHKTTTSPYVTYSWNGGRYGLWAGSAQIPANQLLPANQLAIALHAAVSKQGQQLDFTYTVANSSASTQCVQDIYVMHTRDTLLTGVKVLGLIQGQKDSSFAYAPAGWEVMQPRYIAARRFYASTKRNAMELRHGYEKGGFGFLSTQLPAPTGYYIQGFREKVGRHSDQELQDDLKTNSVHGVTIGPQTPPYPFLPGSFLDTISSYANQSWDWGWIKDQVTANKYLGYFNSAKTSVQQNNIAATRVTLGQVLNEVNVDSTSNLTSEAYALIRYNTEYLLSQLPANPAPGLAVRLINSSGTVLTGGSLQYYEGSWKDAVNNNDGTFNVNTTLTTVSLRMTYAYGSQTKSNVPVNGGPVTFQTVNTQVKLQNSQGALMDQGTVQYYAGAWRDFGVTTNGVASMELLPASYSFRMTYAGGSNDKQQDIGSNPNVVFQTVNAAVQLKNSQGILMDAGTVQYYAGAWKDFGATSNGVVAKELLPNNYSFRMTYAFASKDMQQNIGTNPTVVFSTVNATVQLRNSQGNLIDAGTVQYYAGAWRDFGTTRNGSVSKELLANNYSFRMTYEYVSNDKAQDIGTNSTVGFSTVLCTVRVSNAQGQPVNGAMVSYYSGAWRQIGLTVNGQITKELLPANLSFRASYAGRNQDKPQNLSTNAVVEILLP